MNKELKLKQSIIEGALLRTFKEAKTKEVNKNEYGRKGFEPYDYFKEIFGQN